MAAIFREDIDDVRLKAVTDHVRVWLFISVAKRRSNWSIIARRAGRYWTGSAWSTRSNAALRLQTEKDANAYLAEQCAQLISEPFDGGDGDDDSHPDSQLRIP